MHLIEVIPIARGIARESLSYFGKEEATPGSVVFVPIRKRVIPAVVLRQHSVKEIKAQLRSSAFALRKISPKKIRPFLSEAFIVAAGKTAFYHATTTGSVLYALLPLPLLESIDAIKQRVLLKRSKGVGGTPAEVTSEKLIFQAEFEERMSHYRGMVRESFARSLSIMILAPTIADIEQLRDTLARGIETYVFSFHSGLTKKELVERWQDALNEPHPVLIIGTPSVASLSRSDLGTIVLEKERSRAYKLFQRPHMDTRIFIEYFAQALGIRLILADVPLRIETLWRYQEGELQSLTPPKFRMLSSATVEYVDMRNDPKQPKAPFKVLSEKVKHVALQSIKNNERCFLFAARRGLAGATVCRDCGSIVVGEDGATPLVLHKTARGNAFVSHRTGEMRSAHERCKVCTSWRLEALGVGVERVFEALCDIADKHMIFCVDKDSTPTHRKIKNVMNKFYATPGAVLIGTGRALPYLETPVENSAVVSIDTLLSLPEWRVTERVFDLILSIRERTTRHMVVQTRKTDAPVLPLALSGNIGEFYKSEVELREEFAYPPFSVLIKISAIGTPEYVQKEVETIKQLFENIELLVYPASFGLGKGKIVQHMLLRVPRNEWPDAEMIKKLKTLPPHITVDIDPENLL